VSPVWAIRQMEMQPYWNQGQSGMQARRALGARVEPLTIPTYQMLSRPLVHWLDDGEAHGRGRSWPA